MESQVLESTQQDAVYADRERLQGVWHFVSGSREAQLDIAGDRFTVRFRNGDTYQGNFTLHPVARPKRMDMEIAEGPDRHRGKKALCIYALDGNRLLWAANRPGETDPPLFFPPPEDRDHVHIVFEREKIRVTPK